jgi:hypothetical protein
MQHTDRDLLPAETAGYHISAFAELLSLQRSGKMTEEEAAGRAVAHSLYLANARAVAGRYREEPEEDCWEGILASLPKANRANIATWQEADALGVLECWDYQCSEDPIGDSKAHMALQYALVKFRMELATYAVKTGQRPGNIPKDGGWGERISNATVDGHGPMVLSLL